MPAQRNSTAALEAQIAELTRANQELQNAVSNVGAQAGLWAECWSAAVGQHAKQTASFLEGLGFAPEAQPVAAPKCL